VIAVNKMDLVDWSQQRFEEIRADYSEFAARLQVRDIHFIPMSALKGENVVSRGASMPWFQGSPLLDHLETVHVASDRNLVDLRLPVQRVVRPDLNFRGFAGTIASGVLRVGDPIAVVPSGKQSRVKSIVTFDGNLDEAFASMAVTVTLVDEIDASRGDVIVAPNNAPTLSNAVEAMVVWFNEEPLQVGKQYLVKHVCSQTPAVVTDIRYRINVGDLHREQAGKLEMNEVGRIRVECSRPLAADPYGKNRHMGAFILIDRLSNATVGAAMIVERKTAEDSTQRRAGSADAGTNVRLQKKRLVTPEARKARLGQEPFVLWITGLPRSGKSSIAYALEQRLFEAQRQVHVLDGEILRLGINSDLGFSGADRWENQRRAAELCRLNRGFGISTVVALVSPIEFERQQARQIVGGDNFFEVLCDAPVEACEARDEDGLYRRARAGEIANVTGVDAPYERSKAPEIVLDTVADPVDANVDKILAFLRERGLLR
ncbi:MAG: adenylyl-sulfate kinase, partial [Planctomycetes bacterium]|nr:adenylyl-sulfate kinase [Planctomycetota bacterium]